MPAFTAVLRLLPLLGCFLRYVSCALPGAPFAILRSPPSFLRFWVVLWCRLLRAWVFWITRYHAVLPVLRCVTRSVRVGCGCLYLPAVPPTRTVLRLLFLFCSVRCCLVAAFNVAAVAIFAGCRSSFCSFPFRRCSLPVSCLPLRRSALAFLLLLFVLRVLWFSFLLLCRRFVPCSVWWLVIRVGCVFCSGFVVRCYFILLERLFDSVVVTVILSGISLFVASF